MSQVERTAAGGQQGAPQPPAAEIGRLGADSSAAEPGGPEWLQLLLQGCAAEAQQDIGAAIDSYSALVSAAPDNVFLLLRLAGARAAAGQSCIAIGV